MTSYEVTGGNDYHSIELVVVQQPDGRWRAFPTLLQEPTWPCPLNCLDYFDLPTFPDRYLAETIGVFMAWRYIDTLKVWDEDLRAPRPVGTLE